MRPHQTLLGLAAVSLAFAGCGSDSEGGTPNACDLLSTDEASEILGTPSVDGEEDDDRTIPGSSCRWRAEGTPAGEGDASYAVFISVEGERRAQDFEETLNDEERTSPETGFPPETVDGVGDEAYFYALGEVAPSLRVRVGDDYVEFGVAEDDEHEVTEDQAKDMALQMAEIAVPQFG